MSMTYTSMTKNEIRNILKTNPLGRLATADNSGQPHVVPIGIFSDGQTIFVHTGANTKKARNMIENPQVSLLVDFFLQVPRLELGFVITGKARVLKDPEEIQTARNLMIQTGKGRPSHPDPKNPSVLRVSGMQLRKSGRSPALFAIDVDKITSWKRCEILF